MELPAGTAAVVLADLTGIGGIAKAKTPSFIIPSLSASCRHKLWQLRQPFKALHPSHDFPSLTSYSPPLSKGLPCFPPPLPCSTSPPYFSTPLGGPWFIGGSQWIPNPGYQSSPLMPTPGASAQVAGEGAFGTRKTACGCSRAETAAPGVVGQFVRLPFLTYLLKMQVLIIESVGLAVPEATRSKSLFAEEAKTRDQNTSNDHDSLPPAGGTLVLASHKS